MTVRAGQGWIVVNKWATFQHYAERKPTWIKLYLELNSNDEWLGLPTAARGMLTTIWVEYARSGGRLRVEKCMQLCGKSARSSHLKSLSEAGFIQIVASKPSRVSAPARSREEEKKKNPPNPPVNGGAPKLSQKQVRKYTGCRATRGSHGFGFVRDPLGVDKPPPDWPYERPSKEEVGAALAATSHGSGETPQGGS